MGTTRKIKKTDEAWQAYISTSLRKTAEATLDTAKRIANFKANMTEPKQFQNRMQEWFGMSPAHLSYWARINENLPRFQGNLTLLPTSPRTLYELSALDDNLWDELVQTGEIRSALTVEQAKELKTDGGIRKKVMAEYGDADNYLDIINELNSKLKDATNIPEAINDFSTWLSSNPAVYDEPEPQKKPSSFAEQNDFIDEKPKPVATATKVSKASVAGPSEALRIKCLALFGIYTNKTIVDEEFLRYLDHQAGSDEAKLAAIATLEE